jgi:hypothetical protein
MLVGDGVDNYSGGIIQHAGAVVVLVAWYCGVGMVDGAVMLVVMMLAIVMEV